ncbi:hypothetical protein VP01_104g2 [Puccinia sorghi]|uniref:Uncharacterized protein n=1 Tax=Puccinia sorghi TaxID=27349 RepID=A0A0L6VU60_9BASI|nr:hypothetical protein VP01_104g2 [Puccinia sorghi]
MMKGRVEISTPTIIFFKMTAQTQNTSSQLNHAPGSAPSVVSGTQPAQTNTNSTTQGKSGATPQQQPGRNPMSIDETTWQNESKSTIQLALPMDSDLDNDLNNNSKDVIDPEISHPPNTTMDSQQSQHLFLPCWPTQDGKFTSCHPKSTEEDCPIRSIHFGFGRSSDCFFDAMACEKCNTENSMMQFYAMQLRDASKTIDNLQEKVTRLRISDQSKFWTSGNGIFIL